MLALFADWLQALAGYVQLDRDFDRVHADDYDPSDEHAFEDGWPYCITEKSFWAKQVFAVIGVAILLTAVMPGLIRVAMNGLT